MLTKRKRLVLIIFAILLIDDICRIIKAYINDSRFLEFNFVYSEFSSGVVVHLAIIYAMIVLLTYFIMNFFKTE